jgi:prophage regulatory protein
MSTNDSTTPIPAAFLRMPAVSATVGLSRSTIYSMVKSGDFPVPLKLSRRSTGWRAADVAAWIASRQPSS